MNYSTIHLTEQPKNLGVEESKYEVHSQIFLSEYS